MHPEASDDTQAHTLRPHVPALSAPVDLAQVRQQPAVAQPYAVLALQGHAARACETQLGLGGHAHGTARRRQRVPVMGWPSPRGRAASRGLWGEEDNQRNRDTTRSLSRPRAYQPLWQPCDGGGVYGRTLCRIRNLIWMPSF